MPEFVWKTQHHLADLVLRRFRLTMYRAVGVLAILGALVSLFVFALRSQPLIMAYTWQIFLPPAPGARALALAVLLLCYAWYRVEREHASYPSLSADEFSIAADAYLSEESWRILEKAFVYANRFRHTKVEPLHILAASLLYPTARRVLARLGTPPDKLMATLRNALALVPSGHNPGMSVESEQVMKAAGRLAIERHALHIEASELMLALAKSESGVGEVFDELAITETAIENITAWFSLRQRLRSEFSRQSHRASFRPRHALDRAYLAVATPFLNHFSTDLTNVAARGRLFPCVGREAELAELYRLVEGGRESVVLVGEPGVGKSAVLDGLAYAMVSEEVPAVLQDKHLLSLSLSRLLSGVTPSEAGARLLHAMEEAIRAGNIVLAIEGIDRLVAMSAGAEGELMLAEVVVHAVTKYGLIVIATCGQKEWNTIVSPTPLGQALQPVEIKELDNDRSIQVLESRVSHWEAEHHVFFTYASLEATVVLSRRYMPDRFLPEKSIKLAEEVAMYARQRKGSRTTVSAEDVAQVMAGKVHVPVTQVTQSESEKLLNLEEILHQRIIGQDEAVQLVAKALRRARVNLRDQKRPIASFLFLGPTGVGKTELAKVVAAEYFGGEDKMVRLDMSEYQTAESLYRLVGAPVGVGEGHGLLTEIIRRNPYALVLLDEIEKAHPDILNVFLQLLDDGRLTDATGKTVDFTNCIIIATSNAGTQFIQDNMRAAVPLEQIRKALLEGGLQQYFKPEFLNRFDGVVVFKPLGRSDVEKIAGLLIGKVAKGLEEKGIHLQASPKAISELAIKGFDPLFGARPLRRVIQEDIDNALATYLLSGKLTRRDVVVLEPGGVMRVEKAGKL